MQLQKKKSDSALTIQNHWEEPLVEPGHSSTIEDAVTRETGTSGKENVTDSSLKRATYQLAGLVSTALAGLALFLATVASPQPAGDETVHANWQKHVAELTDRNKTASNPVLKYVNRGGQEVYTSNLQLSDADFDSMTTRNILTFLESGDLKGANDALQRAQQIPELDSELSESIAAPQPSIQEGMQAELMNGNAKFYSIFICDSCDQDGDVVRVLLDGVPFAVVPITNAGVTLSVPVGSGTTISLEGVRDGVGGITVACRTSQGDYFTSAMAPGSIQPIALVK